ncbi:hypothetical protein [Pedobacter boryungensis]|uniref:Uncharacterized protein n=1 Tax=Pedobacter boryungensis TaxID=869962 RepID=A0ABX2DDH4_9SPHI|nr:hypothetical protein [Pedobacter boryungensis]NQX32065.1 hypothetical protein [Pedobacter boryungensis]
MKINRLIPFVAVLIILFFFSCKEKRPIKTKIDKKFAVCYIAIDKTDTAWLKIDTADRKHILGEMIFNYHNEKHYKGLIKGLMNGDTLKGDYTFRLNGIDKWYRNPIALLKNEHTLTMGVGEIYILWGSGFFLNSVPIDYDKGRFVFKQTDCKD